MSEPAELKPKRVVFPIAGKGGVGKTTVVAALAEWYASNGHKADLLDMDPENKAEGSLKALFTHAHKLPALESWSYDKLLGISIDSDADIILADMGAAQGHQMIPWFRDFYRAMQDSGLDLRWTALGVVDGDIASARSVLEWGHELQDSVDYVIVHNHFHEGSAVGLERSEDRRRCGSFPGVVCSYRDPSRCPSSRSPEDDADDERDLERCGGQEDHAVPELLAPDMTLRARTYRFRAYAQFTEARKVLLP